MRQCESVVIEVRRGHKSPLSNSSAASDVCKSQHNKSNSSPRTMAVSLRATRVGGTKKAGTTKGGGGGAGDAAGGAGDCGECGDNSARGGDRGNDDGGDSAGSRDDCDDHASVGDRGGYDGYHGCVRDDANGVSVLWLGKDSVVKKLFETTHLEVI